VAYALRDLAGPGRERDQVPGVGYQVSGVRCQGNAPGFVCRILVAEDNPVNQKVAAGMLDKLGCRVDVVTNGLEALDAYARAPYDLIFMDCQMPEMDGIAATREIRAREKRDASCVMRDESAGVASERPDALPITHHSSPITPHRIPIIAMTANAMQGHRERCLAAGMDDYVSKPVSQETLQRVLHRWLPQPPGERHETRSAEEVRRSTFDVQRQDSTPISDTNPRTSSVEPRTCAARPEVFDRAAALVRLEGDQILLGELTIIFLRHASDMVTAIQGAVERKDFIALEQAAHSLKGAAANLCASRVADAARRLEQIGQQGASDRLSHALQDLHRELTDLRPALAKFGKEARPCVS
jgi:CheY-like chemotaxis protein/HPt (histidine-containing phosphotransfer) domain-containing protein